MKIGIISDTHDNMPMIQRAVSTKAGIAIHGTGERRAETPPSRSRHAKAFGIRNRGTASCFVRKPNNSTPPARNGTVACRSGAPGHGVCWAATISKMISKLRSTVVLSIFPASRITWNSRNHTKVP